MNNLSPTLTGVMLMVLSMTAFTVNDAFVKLAAQEIPLFVAIALRGVGITVGLFLWAWRQGQLRIKLDQRDWRLTLWRTTAEVGATVVFLTALMQMPIANLSAIMQALPLTVALAAAIFLGEPLGWRRVGAIVVGFVGVLLIVRPGAEGFTIYALLGVGAVVLVTVRDLAARKLSPKAPSLLVALVAAVAVTVLGFVGAAIGGVWVWPSLGGWWALTIASLSLVVGYYSAIAAMRIGDIGTIAPFRYTSLLVALVLGYLMFDELPDALALLGAGLLVASGLYALYRERKLARAPVKRRS